MTALETAFRQRRRRSEAAAAQRLVSPADADATLEKIPAKTAASVADAMRAVLAQYEFNDAKVTKRA